MIYVLLIVVFLAVFSLCYLILTLMRRATNPLLKKIKSFNSNNPGNSQNHANNGIKQKLTIPFKIQKVLVDFGQLTKTAPEKISKIRQNLIQAGHYSEESVKTFMGWKVVFAMVFFICTVYVGSLGDRSLPMVVLMSMLAGFVGYRIPDLILSSWIRKRQQQIAAGLPDALDLLVISVEAGLSLNAALLRVSTDLKLRCPSIAEEFNRVTHDLRTGISREEALRKLSNRNKVEDLRILVGALILADRLGTSIADTLRAQADSLRTRIQQKAQEKAAKAGIKILLPLVLFILPALIIILMGPGLIAVFRTLSR